MVRIFGKWLQLTGGQLSFASTERLTKFLGVVPGSVSPLAVINDHANKVQVYIEAALLEQDFIYLHPCRNTHTTRMRCDGLVTLLDSWNHDVAWRLINGLLLIFCIVYPPQ